jgi:hypothetical protein
VAGLLAGSVPPASRPIRRSLQSAARLQAIRDRKFPRSDYPELYTERTLGPRLAAKLSRTYKDGRPVHRAGVLQVGQVGVADLQLDCEVDAIVTSPPYMNALDYVRDNRLRMWFLDRRTADYSLEPTDKQDESDAITTAFARNALKYLRAWGHCVLIVGETVLRKRMTSHPAERIFAKLLVEYPTLSVKQVIQDEIPDVRRSRRTGSATKRELILVLKKG